VSHLPFCLFLFLPFLLFTGCAGNNFDETTIPPEQVATEMSFKRMADHGGIEPVIEIEQPIQEWQFHIRAYSKVAVLGSEPTIAYTLGDRSGIKYTVSSASTDPEILGQLTTGSYGYATGRVISVDRDFAAGTVAATIGIEAWRERE
jgi:hypothetical protein